MCEGAETVPPGHLRVHTSRFAYIYRGFGAVSVFKIVGMNESRSSVRGTCGATPKESGQLGAHLWQYRSLTACIILGNVDDFAQRSGAAEFV